MPVGSWTNITNAQLAVGAPIRSLDLLALRDNAIYANAIRVQTFVTSGSFTIPNGVEAIKVTVTGGGGNGGNNGPCGSGAGGGGGATAIQWFSGLTSGSTLTVTRGGVSGTSSVSSGTQTITTVSAAGGSGGGSNGGAGGAGGLASGGFLNVKGEDGGSDGGDSMWGRGGTWPGAGNGPPGVGYGAGGAGGGFNAGNVGGAGIGGVILIEW